MIGLAALPREPSLVWQAAQTAVEIASPLAGSGFAGGRLGGEGAGRGQGSGERAEQSRNGLHGSRISRAKPGNFTMTASRRPHEHLHADPCGFHGSGATTPPPRRRRSPGPTPRASSRRRARSTSCRVTELPEIAFVGRSNAGKSTAINVLTQQKRLAFASKTPGRTQHINLFELGPKLAADALFADLPGYGYAAVERNAKLRWQEVMAEYLAVRRSLSAIVDPGRLAPRLHRHRQEAARLRRAAPGQRLGEAARAADQGRQAQSPRRCRGAARPRATSSAK